MVALLIGRVGGLHDNKQSRRFCQWEFELRTYELRNIRSQLAGSAVLSVLTVLGTVGRGGLRWWLAAYGVACNGGGCVGGCVGCRRGQLISMPTCQCSTAHYP